MLGKLQELLLGQRIFVVKMICCFHDLSGSKVASPGESVGKGLTKTAAADLGLWEGMPVGTALIDAHAGGLGKSAYR